jgi:hypothetical protein
MKKRQKQKRGDWQQENYSPKRQNRTQEYNLIQHYLVIIVNKVINLTQIKISMYSC